MAFSPTTLTGYRAFLLLKLKPHLRSRRRCGGRAPGRFPRWPCSSYPPSLSIPGLSFGGSREVEAPFPSLGAHRWDKILFHPTHPSCCVTARLSASPGHPAAYRALALTPAVSLWGGALQISGSPLWATIVGGKALVATIVCDVVFSSFLDRGCPMFLQASSYPLASPPPAFPLLSCQIFRTKPKGMRPAVVPDPLLGLEPSGFPDEDPGVLGGGPGLKLRGLNRPHHFLPWAGYFTFF